MVVSDRPMAMVVVRANESGRLAWWDVERFEADGESSLFSSGIAGEFSAKAGDLSRCLSDADVCGWDVRAVGLPLLEREFDLHDIVIDMSPGFDRVVVDLADIHRARVPGSLEMAFRYYMAWSVGSLLNKMQVEFGLPAEHASLAKSSLAKNGVDRHGIFRWTDAGQIVIAWGEHAGTPVPIMVQRHADYLRRMVSSGLFGYSVERIISEAFVGRYPERG